MTTPTPNRRWHHITPARFILGLLAVQVLLSLSDQFNWLPFNERKGWTVLIAVGVVGLAVLAMLVWGIGCLCLRRPFQFSFRSLLLFVVAASVPLGWFAWEMQRARRQREAVGAIAEAGGHVRYKCEFAALRPYPLEQTTLAWLRTLLGIDFFEEVGKVDCGDTGFDDNDARCLQELRKLAVLRLDRTHITDEGLAHLETLANLKVLWLYSTEITDNGLAHLRGMSELSTLGLNNTQITDSGLVHLEKMPQLTSLFLTNTHVTDRGLLYLEEMPGFLHLWLEGTQVTDQGVEELKKVFPACDIHRTSDEWIDRAEPR